jgi:18S rRNA (guanine1575-N7)-methyltransferase
MLLLFNNLRGFNFRVGLFDGAISISAVQWLLQSNSKNDKPIKRITKFFSSLYKCLKKGARAVIQLYTETPTQMEIITNWYF